MSLSIYLNALYRLISVLIKQNRYSEMNLMFFLSRLHVLYVRMRRGAVYKGETIRSLFGSGCSEGQPLADGAVMLQTARAKHEGLPTFHPEPFCIRKDRQSSTSITVRMDTQHLVPRRGTVEHSHAFSHLRCRAYVCSFNDARLINCGS